MPPPNPTTHRERSTGRALLLVAAAGSLTATEAIAGTTAPFDVLGLILLVLAIPGALLGGLGFWLGRGKGAFIALALYAGSIGALLTWSKCETTQRNRQLAAERQRSVDAFWSACFHRTGPPFHAGGKQRGPLTLSVSDPSALAEMGLRIPEDRRSRGPQNPAGKGKGSMEAIYVQVSPIAETVAGGSWPVRGMQVTVTDSTLRKLGTFEDFYLDRQWCSGASPEQFIDSIVTGLTGTSLDLVERTKPGVESVPVRSPAARLVRLGTEPFNQKLQLAGVRSADQAALGLPPAAQCEMRQKGGRNWTCLGGEAGENQIPVFALAQSVIQEDRWLTPDSRLSEFAVRIAERKLSGELQLIWHIRLPPLGGTERGPVELIQMQTSEKLVTLLVGWRPCAAPYEEGFRHACYSHTASFEVDLSLPKADH